MMTNKERKNKSTGADLIAKQKAHLKEVRLEGNPEQVLLALGAVGRTLLKAGHASESLQYFEQATALAKEQDAPDERARNLGNQGIALARLGQIDEAMARFDEVLSLAESLESDALSCDALLQKAQVLLDIKRGDMAYEVLTQAQELAKKSGLDARLLQVYNLLGQTHLLIASVEEAAAYFEKALEIAVGLKDRVAEGGSYINLATAYLAGGAPKAAQKHFSAALGVSRELGDSQGERTALTNLIKASVEAEDPESVIRYTKVALELTRERSDTHSQIMHLNTLILTLAELKSHQEALAYIDEALGIARQIKDKERELSLLINYGNTHYELEQLAEAQATYEQALDLTVKLQDWDVEARVLGRLSAVLADRGKEEEAKSYTQRALKKARKVGNQYLVGEQLMLLAFNHRDQEEYEKANEFALQVKDEFQTLEAPEAQAMVAQFLKELDKVSVN